MINYQQHIHYNNINCVGKLHLLLCVIFKTISDIGLLIKECAFHNNLNIAN